MDPRIKALTGDLQRIFGARLQSLVAYGALDHPDGVHTLALVERLSFQDLAACAPQTAQWRRAGAAVPLLLARDEFLRTLDVFPIEYGEIIDNHVLVAGKDLLAGLRVSESDLRRACELQAKSHLIHLREGYLESGGVPKTIGRLITASAASLASLLVNLERLDEGIGERAGLTARLVQEVASADTNTIADPSALLARYIGAAERLWQEVDRWRS